MKISDFIRSKKEEFLLIGILLLYPFITMSIFSNAFLPIVENGDAWPYIDTGLNLTTHINLGFGACSYSVSRLSWMLPVYLMHSFFQPIVAHYILVLSCYYLFIMSLYFTIRLYSDYMFAFSGAIMFATAPYFVGQLSSYYPAVCGMAWMSLSFLFLNLGIKSENFKKKLLFYFMFGFFALFPGLAHLNILTIYAVVSFFHFSFANFFSMKFRKFVILCIICFAGFIASSIFWGIINLFLGGDFFVLKSVLGFGSNLLNSLDYPTEPYFYLFRTYLVSMMWALIAAIIYLIIKIRIFINRNFDFRSILQIDVVLSCLIAAFLTYRMAACMIDKDNVYSLYYLFWGYLGFLYLMEPLYNKFSKKAKLTIVLSYFLIAYLLCWVVQFQSLVYRGLLFFNSVTPFKIFSLYRLENCDSELAETTILIFWGGLIITALVVIFKKYYKIGFPLFLFTVLLCINHVPNYMCYGIDSINLAENLRFVTDANRFMNRVANSVITKPNETFLAYVVQRQYNDIITQPRLLHALPYVNENEGLDGLDIYIDKFKKQQYKLFILTTRDTMDSLYLENKFKKEGIFLKSYVNEIFFNNGVPYYYYTYKMFDEKKETFNILNLSLNKSNLKTSPSSKKNLIITKNDSSLEFIPSSLSDHCTTEWIKIENLRKNYTNGRLFIKIKFNKVATTTMTIGIQNDKYDYMAKKTNIIPDTEFNISTLALDAKAFRVIFYSTKENIPIILPSAIEVEYEAIKKIQ